jgi:hypothetical protein
MLVESGDVVVQVGADPGHLALADAGVARAVP